MRKTEIRADQDDAAVLAAKLDYHDDPLRAENAAGINHMLTLLASSIRELDQGMRNGLEHPAAGTEKHLQDLLHGFNALLTVRVNLLLETCAGSEVREKLIDVLEGLRSESGGLCFFGLQEISESAPSLIKNLWAQLGEVGLAWGQIHVRQYDGRIHQAGPEVAARLEEIADELVIDRKQPRPQNGYGRPVPAAEFEEFLATKGARLFLLHQGGNDVGFFIVLTERNYLPADAERVVSLTEGGGKAQDVGWLPIVGISKEGREGLKAAGLNAYELLSSALAQSCHTLGFDRLLGEVRLGDQANLAIAAHQRIGFRETDLRTMHGNTPYQVLELDPRDVPFLVNPDLIREGIDIPDLLHQAQTKLPSLERIVEQWSYRDPRTVGPVELCAPNGDIGRLEQYIDQHLPRSCAAMVSTLSEGIAVQLTSGNLRFTVRQVVPNQDLWTCDFADNRYRIGTFADAMAGFNAERELLGV